MAGSGRAAGARSVSDLFRLAVVLSGGDQLAKPNFEYQKRQKELSRKSRQAEKLQRRTGKTETADASPVSTNTAEVNVQGGTRPEST